MPKGYESASALPGSFPAPDFRSELHQKLRISAKSSKGFNPAKANLPTLLETLEPGEQDKVDMLALAIDLLGRFADMYKGLEGFIELYDPILEIVQHIRDQNLKGLKGLQVRNSVVVFNVTMLSFHPVTSKFSTRYAKQTIKIRASITATSAIAISQTDTNTNLYP